MSLSKLPSHVFAEIGTFLEFEDLKNLLATNKNVNKAVKNCKLNKPQYHELFLELDSDGTIPVILMKHYKTSSYVEYPHNYIKLFRNTSPSRVVEILEKFRVIEEVNIVGLHKISNYYLKKLMDMKVKINHVCFTQSEAKDSDIEFSMDVFFQLYKTFKRITFRGSEINLGRKIANDEVFAKLLKFSWIDFENSLRLLSRTVSYRADDLTDKTLEAMISNQMPKKFSVRPWITAFTIQGIRKLFEYARLEDVLWDFGVLDAVYMDEAEAFMAGLDTTIFLGEREEKLRYASFLITRNDSCQHIYSVEFAVIWDESDNEDEDFDEDEEEDEEDEEEEEFVNNEDFNEDEIEEDEEAEEVIVNNEEMNGEPAGDDDESDDSDWKMPSEEENSNVSGLDSDEDMEDDEPD